MALYVVGTVLVSGHHFVKLGDRYARHVLIPVVTRPDDKNISLHFDSGGAALIAGQAELPVRGCVRGGGVGVKVSRHRPPRMGVDGLAVVT